MVLYAVTPYIRRLVAVALLLTGLGMMSHAQATEYWMSPGDPYGRGKARPDLAQDFLDLFTVDAPWTAATRQLTVFKVGPAFVDYAPDEILRQVFADLKSRGIALAWEMGAVPPGRNCGRGEGYAGDTARSVARIKAAGGELRYAAMDEPFWYGHHLATKNTCQLSIDELARGVAERLNVVRSAFPDVRIVDIEPVGDPQVKDYPEQIAEWLDAFHAATGHQLAFFHADINWDGPWRGDLPALQQRLAKLGVAFGVIINGDPLARSDLEWTNAAIDHLQQVVDLVGLQPETIIFQTWDDRPTRVLPEDRPGSFTNLVLEGTRPAAKITFIPQRDAIVGRVTDISGKPVIDAPVDITARDVGGFDGLHMAERTGMVPQNAVRALFGLRVGVECNCSGPIDVSIGELRFRDDPSPDTVRFLQDRPGPYQLQGVAGQKASINTTEFPVHAGASYAVHAAMRVREPSDRAGYLALFFLDATGKEIRRDLIQLKAPEESLGTPVTDRAGIFSLQLPATVDPSRLLVRARVEANKSTRATIAERQPGVN